MGPEEVTESTRAGADRASPCCSLHRADPRSSLTRSGHLSGTSRARDELAHIFTIAGIQPLACRRASPGDAQRVPVSRQAALGGGQPSLGRRSNSCDQRVTMRALAPPRELGSGWNADSDLVQGVRNGDSEGRCTPCPASAASSASSSSGGSRSWRWGVAMRSW